MRGREGGEQTDGEKEKEHKVRGKRTKIEIERSRGEASVIRRKSRSGRESVNSS